ncbi:uncharacterized protein LOC110705414 isoform X1 [Chenopodium quinoa]|uniref:uncharacterized protein LOC110705414 isoform X1 n=1 Tax=Chenopodium quinoa TaxID=63459 RepID=UPI000B7739E4|nr:uncharacterized protein LOC110705414 isoform X1 [Chenopodium quinoa]
MAFLAFILDLRTLSPQFLKLIKDSLLQFANLFVLSSLNDRIALCYLQSESELKVAYSPESFNLLDWHDAVNALSCCYAPHLLERTTLPKDGNLALILNDRMLVSARRKETKGKIILIGACIQSKVDSTVILPVYLLVTFIMKAFQTSLKNSDPFNFKVTAVCSIQDAEGRDNYVESVILKNCDMNNLCDAFLQDELGMNKKAKKWIEELKDDRGLEASFLLSKEQ